MATANPDYESLKCSPAEALAAEAAAASASD